MKTTSFALLVALATTSATLSGCTDTPYKEMPMAATVVAGKSYETSLFSKINTSGEALFVQVDGPNDVVKVNVEGEWVDCNPSCEDAVKRVLGANAREGGGHSD